jgi:uncharacterized protein YjbI with pentapeptide repeats
MVGNGTQREIRVEDKLPLTQTIHPPKLPKRLPRGNLQRLENQGEYTEFEIMGCDFTAQSANDVLFEQIHIHRAIFTQVHLTKLRFTDVCAEVCDFSSTNWENPRLRRVEFIGCRLLGVQWLEAQCDDVLFKDCILEGAVLVNTIYNAVHFEKCNLRSAILEESNLSGVVFSNCDLTNASLRASTLYKTDLRGSILNGVQANPQDLRGAIIEPAQAIQVVGLLGVKVQDYDG